MNGECNATNVQGKNYNLHKLQGGGARAPVPHSWWRHWLQWHTCTFRHALRAAYRTAISAEQILVIITSHSLQHAALSVLMAIFQVNLSGKLRLACYIWATDDGVGGDNWSYKTYKAPVKWSPPSNQHPDLYRPDALPVTQPAASTCLLITKFCISLSSSRSTADNWW